MHFKTPLNLKIPNSFAKHIGHLSTNKYLTPFCAKKRILINYYSIYMHLALLYPILYNSLKKQFSHKNEFYQKVSYCTLS